MTNTIFQNIACYFESLDYQSIPTDSQTVKMFATYQLENLYLINIIELNDEYTFDYERYLAYRELTKRQFSDVGAEKVFLLNLLLVENPDLIYRDVNYSINLNDNFIDAHWIVDTTYHELVIPKKQVKHLLGLEYAISTTIQEEDLPNYKIHEKNKTAYISGLLNISILAVFILMEFISGAFSKEGFLRFGGLKGSEIFQGFELWRLFTYYVVHVSALHLLINSVFIFYMGSKLERFLRWWEYIAIVLGSSIFAGLFAGLINLIKGTDSVTVGASGMVYGIIGSLLVYSKLTKKSIDGLSELGILIVFLIGIAFGISNELISIATHIGGFIGGVVITLVILRNYKNRVKVEVE